MTAPTKDSFDVWERRIVDEFTQCPALRLSAVQAARLWGLEIDTARTLLDTLVTRQMLFRMADGIFVRRGVCPRCE